MKKISTFLLLLLAGAGLNSVYGQTPTPLYAGEKNSSTLSEIDTTGGGFSVVGTVSMTSDFGPVNSVHGLALDPTSDEMYILYESTGAGSDNRRLGVVDPMSGSITDIGGTGYYHNDLEFGPDGTLYASSSSWDTGTYEFREIDKVTAASSFLFNYVASNNETGICYNPFADEMIKMGGFSTDLSTINLGTLTETSEAHTGSSPNRASASVVYSATKALIATSITLYTLNPVTNEFATVGPVGTWYHAFAFGPTPCTPIDITVSADSICAGEMITLTATGIGTITWDGGVVDGVAFDPGAPGTYYYTPTSDSDDDCAFDEPPVTIVVVGNPTVIAGAGDGHFCVGETVTLSAAGDAHVYEWNDGAPLDLNPPVGTHTYTLTGAYTGACEAETTVEIEITMHALPTITGSVDASPICLGNEVTLTGAGGDTYSWNMGAEDNVAFSPNTVGTTTYTVVGWDEFGCENTADVDVTVVDEIVITVVSSTLETVGSDGAIDIDVAGGAPTYTYDWDNDGTGDFDDDQDLTGLTSGLYTVVVKGSAGCETTRTFDLGSQVGIDAIDAIEVLVYPNPTAENINIEYNGTFNYELVAINGDVLATGTGTNKEVISLKELASGIYFVNVNYNNTTSTVKVVKK